MSLAVFWLLVGVYSPRSQDLKGQQFVKWEGMYLAVGQMSTNVCAKPLMVWTQ